MNVKRFFLLKKIMGDLVVQYSGFNQTKNEIHNLEALIFTTSLLSFQIHSAYLIANVVAWFIPVNYKVTKRLS